MANMANRKYICHTCNKDFGSATALRKHFDKNPSHMTELQRENRRRNAETKRNREERARMVRGKDPVPMTEIKGAKEFGACRCKCHVCQVSFTTAKLAGAHFAKYPDHRTEQQQAFYDKDKTRTKAYRTRKSRRSSAKRKAAAATPPATPSVVTPPTATTSVYICPTCNVDYGCAAALAKHYLAEPGHVTEKTMKSRRRNASRGTWRREPVEEMVDLFNQSDAEQIVDDELAISASEPMEIDGLVPHEMEVELVEGGIRVGGQVFPLVTGQRYSCNFCPHCGFSLEAVHDAIDPELVPALSV
jgi:hypothetical protein